MSYVFHGGENKRGRNRISIDIVVILIIVVFFCIRCIVVLNNYRERGAYAYVQLLNYCMPVVEELNYDASDYAENNLSIKKSRKGSVGCINATKNNAIGEFNNNTTFGIKGEINNINLSNYKKYKVASINEVKLGKAQIILQNKNNVCKKYDIEIINIEHQKKADSKGIKIKITDPLLLKETGGIVQGMSGTPIIQDNKIVGAVSHALENNPSIGYGVYIKWMLEYNK